MKRFYGLVLMALAMVLPICVGVAEAEEHDKLTRLLVDREGWQGQPAQGRSLFSAQMKVISARRVYSQGEKGLTVSIIVNSGPLLDSDLRAVSSEDEMNKINVRQVQGFWVKTIQSKKKNSGQVFVYLAYNQETNSQLLCSYSNISSDEAVAELQKFNWVEIKEIVTPML
ncbi:MAG: hypothetical protein HGA96_14945 [Desulfobulbaceae bacterium]|nr:hypothetical protein [Desulfobulbaceae bacterium]